MTVPPVAGPYLASVLLLGAAGLAKALRPHDTAVALRSAGLTLRLSRTVVLVRAGAIAEVIIAGSAVVGPGPVPAGLVALSYLGFAAFVAAALLRRWPLASCGCFGRPDSRPTVAHVVVNAVAALCATWWALAAPAAMTRALAGQPGHGLPLALGAVVCGSLAYLVLANPLAQARLRPQPGRWS